MADFFTIEKRDKRWWFITPDGAPFWSIGINHIDLATLRYAESDGVWESEFYNIHGTVFFDFAKLITNKLIQTIR